MQIDRIDHLNITVADLDRSIEFYERVLGLKSERMGEGRAALLFGNQKIHLDLAGALRRLSPALRARRCSVHSIQAGTCS